MQLRPHHLALSLVLFAAHVNAQISPLLPAGVAFDTAGNLYFADANRHQVFEATLGGQLIVVAGNGTQGFAGDTGAATAAQLNGPQAVAFGPDGTLFVADTGNQRVRAIAANGTITTVAGTGKQGFSGDNGPASAAAIASPNALAVAPDGTLYIADSGNHRIRRIASGTITTVAGNGAQGFSGDNGPASSAQLDTPSGLAVSTAGLVYIADTHNHRVRLVNASGIITTVAGTGAPGYSGDNAPAAQAQLDGPRGLAVTPTGALLIADANNQRLRSIAPNGIISTLAGGSTQGLTADATTALAASLNNPRSVAVTSFGYPVLTDAGSHTLRILAADGNLYLPAALTGRTSTVTLSAPSAATFGQAMATVTVTGAAPPQGTVRLIQNNNTAATATLTSGTVVVPLTTLSTGSYTLTAAYAGDGINPAATSPAVTLTIGRAATATVTQPPAQNAYATLPMLLNANVTSAARGTPTGTVNFTDTSSNTTVATTQLTNGIASAVYLAPTAGNHTIAAAYLGDTNFAPSTSPVVAATVQPLPDFTLTAAGTATQTVVSGFPATYNLTLASLAAPFTGAVSLSVTGLPAGFTAAFAPSQAVPGASSVPVVLTVQTPAQRVSLPPADYPILALIVLPVLLLRRRRCLALLPLIALAACGTRINQPPSAAAGVYNLTVTATGTNLAGALSVHSASLTLNVQ